MFFSCNLLQRVIIILCLSFLLGCSNELQTRSISELTSKIWITDSIGNYYSNQKTPVILIFYKDTAVLSFPELKSHFEIASIVHIHGTTLAGLNSNRFVYEYSVENDGKTVILEDDYNDIELKFYSSKLKWPLWHTNDSIEFSLAKNKQE